MIDWFWLIPVVVIALALGIAIGRRMKSKAYFTSGSQPSHSEKTAARALGAASRELPP